MVPCHVCQSHRVTQLSKPGLAPHFELKERRASKPECFLAESFLQELGTSVIHRHGSCIAAFGALAAMKPARWTGFAIQLWREVSQHQEVCDDEVAIL